MDLNESNCVQVSPDASQAKATKLLKPPLAPNTKLASQISKAEYPNLTFPSSRSKAKHRNVMNAHDVSQWDEHEGESTRKITRARIM